MGVLSAAPTDPEQQYHQHVAALERRIADLERAFGRYRGGAGAPGGTGVNGQEYWDSTNKRLYRSDGVGWIIMYEPEQTYTPTFSNTVLGNGTVTGKYKRAAGLCTIDDRFSLGSTSTVTGPTTVTLPVQAIRLERGSLSVFFTDTGGSISVGWNNRDSMTAPTIGATVTSNPYATAANLAAGIPFAWAVNCEMGVSGTYTMNTPYL